MSVGKKYVLKRLERLLYIRKCENNLFIADRVMIESVKNPYSLY
jgi:hypothetical protein